jgi:hypothetical protein
VHPLKTLRKNRKIANGRCCGTLINALLVDTLTS